MSGWYERVVFNRLLDAALDRPEIHIARKATLAGARGDVLEIGLGTGLNVGDYPARVDAITTLGPEVRITDEAAARARRLNFEIDHVTGRAESMPFDDARFDTVVSTFVLCSVADPARAASEIGRVLKPTGRLLVLEHVAASKASTRSAQRFVDPLMRIVNCGCRLTRDVERTLSDAGFAFDELVRVSLPALPWLYRDVVRAVAFVRSR